MESLLTVDEMVDDVPEDVPRRREGRRHRRRQRSITDSLVVIACCFLYASAVTTVLGSLVTTQILDHQTRHYKNTSDLSNPCILYGTHDGDSFQVGDNLSCIVTLGGEALLSLLCIVLFIISVIRLIVVHKGTFCFLCVTFVLLLASLVVGFSVAMNFSIGSGKTCDSYDDNTNDQYQHCRKLKLPGTGFEYGQYVYYTQVGLWTCYGALMFSLLLEILFTCCVCSKKERRNRSRSHRYYEHNNWLDRSALAAKSSAFTE